VAGCIVFFRHEVFLADNPYPHLTDIGFERLAPVAALRPFVRWYWSIRSNGRLAKQRDEFMHPDGGTGLVFNWGDKLQMPVGNYPQAVTLDTVWSQSQRLKLAGQVDTFGIRFRPGGAYALFGVPMDELTETAVLSDHIAPNQLENFHGQLSGFETLADKVAVVEEWLLRQLVQPWSVSSLVPPALSMIARVKGQLPMQDVADAMYVSPRQMERLFKTQVGMSPKKYARIMRMGKARDLLKANCDQAHVAQSAGFYDQSHFIREFKFVVGMTPGAYGLRRRENYRD